MKCTACNKDLNKKEIVYTEDRQPYCQNPFTCNDDHPNSVKNILARGGAANLYTEDELENNIFERLNITPEMKERILRVATKPQSIRLSKYEIAHYLLAKQDEKDLSSISEAVRYCVQLAMEMEPIGSPRSIQVRPAPEPELQVFQEAAEKSAEELQEEAKQKITIPDMPKSINVDWDNLPPLERDPITNPEPIEDEDEMTF